MYILLNILIFISFIKPILDYFFIMHYGKIISNMNYDNNYNSIYNNSSFDFDNAYLLSGKNFTHDELIKLLVNGSIQEKQIAAIKLEYINDENDAIALLNNLTKCDGKIREAVAFKINQLLNKSSVYRKIFSEISAEVFADATIDINANICRLVIDSAEQLKDSKTFSNAYISKIIKFANIALNELNKFIFRDKKYVINKQIFKLYWCLEAITIFADNIDYKILENILTRCISQKEYTIREKVAKILIKTKKFNNLKELLYNDENYYVRQILNH